jgi:hypothetical protein
MVHSKHVYVVGTPSDTGEFASIGRSWAAPRRILAWTRIEDAVFAEASGEVCIPGYFIGDDSPAPMSSLGAEEIVAELREAGLEALVNLSIWEDELDFWSEGTRLWVETLTAEQAAVLRRVFDRHADPAIVGRRAIYRVDLED